MLALLLAITLAVPIDDDQVLAEIDAAQRASANTWVQLYNWTEHKGEASEYAAPLKRMLYLDFPSALMECAATGEVVTDVEASVLAAFNAYNDVMLPVMTLPGELAILREHNQATKRYVDLCTDCLDACLNPPPPSMDVTAFVTPTSIMVPGMPTINASKFLLSKTVGANTWSGGGGNKFPGVIDRTVPNLVLVKSGDYSNDRLTYGPLPNPPPLLHLLAEELGGPVIHFNPVGGSQSFYPENWHNFLLEGFVILGDDLSAIQGEIPAHRGWLEVQTDHHYKNCQLLGSWDGTVGGRMRDKWGTNRYELGGSSDPNAEYGSTWIVDDENVGWSGGFREQVFYEHGIIAPGMLIRGGKYRWTGRSLLHVAARSGDMSGPSNGLMHLADVEAWDHCVEDNGGGSYVDVKGHTGTLLLENCRFYAGCDPNLHSSVSDNITGAMAIAENGLGYPSLVIVRDCHFEVGRVFPGKGSARRSNVKILAATRFELWNSTIQQHPGAFSIALDIKTNRLDELVLDSSCVVLGDCQVDGKKFKDPNLDGAGYLAMIGDFVANPPDGYTVELW